MDKHRWGVVVCHRRLGKTVAAINHLVKGACSCQLPLPRFHYVAPTYRMAKKIAWDYLKYFTADIPGIKPNESDLKVDIPLNNSSIQLLGGEEPNAHRGIYSDGVVFDEYGLMLPSLFNEVFRPALADRRGWALFMGTPAGKNLFYDTWRKSKGNKDWFRVMYKASQTGLIPQEELDAARKQMTQDEYDQEFECSFYAAVKGAYYAHLINDLEREGHIREVPYQRDLLVHTAWDLGVGDSTAIIFFQVVGAEVRIIDYLEATGQGLHYYISELRKRKYLYGEHIGPHDLRVRELGSGMSRLEMAQNMGLDFSVCNNLRVEDGIAAARELIPRLWIDDDKCGHLVECLRHYRADFDERRNTFTTIPVRDWTSHGADALRYLAIHVSSIYSSKQSITKRDRYVRHKPSRTTWMSI